jgi:hypothetical protein
MSARRIRRGQFVRNTYRNGVHAFGALFALVVACSTDEDAGGAGPIEADAHSAQEGGGAVPEPDGAPTPRDASEPSRDGSNTEPADDGGNSNPERDAGGTPDVTECVPTGQPAGTGKCCKGSADLLGNCCTGTSCCLRENHSHKGTSGECECDVGYIASGPSSNLGCRLDPKLGPHVVACEQSATLGYVTSYCECTAKDTNTGSPMINGTCRKDFDATIALEQVCCEQAGYPRSGGCVCAVRAGPYKCTSSNSQSCSCTYLRATGVPAESTCNVNEHARDNQPIVHTDPSKWLCCADPSRGSCECTNYKTYCGTGRDGKPKQVVSDCKDPAALGFTTPPANCKTGDREVTTCNGTSTCTSDSQCGGSCSGSDPFCCPTCSGGKCMTCCTGSSGTACF